MNLVLCTDEGYAPYCAVVMVSAMRHASNPQLLRFFILTPGLKPATETALHDLARQYGAQVNVVTAESKLAKDNIDLLRFGPSSVMRLSMHDYLPPDCQRAIYLDCDLLVLKDIQALWELDLGHYTVGAVTDLCSPATFAERSRQWPHYCNSGVLLIDLERWRNQHVGERALDYIRQHADTLVYFDQDAINHALDGQWQSLDLSWNLQSAAYSAYEKDYDYLASRRTEIERALQYPGIVHFIGGVKPWHAECTHPLQGLFIQFSKLTPWPIDDVNVLRAPLAWRKRMRMSAKAFKINRRRKMLRNTFPARRR